MSTANLNNLLTYLSSALTASNKKWLAEHLIEQSKSNHSASTSETEYIASSKEMLDVIAKGDEQIASGNFTTTNVSDLWN